MKINKFFVGLLFLYSIHSYLLASSQQLGRYANACVIDFQTEQHFTGTDLQSIKELCQLAERDCLFKMHPQAQVKEIGVLGDQVFIEFVVPPLVPEKKSFIESQALQESPKQSKNECFVSFDARMIKN